MNANGADSMVAGQGGPETADVALPVSTMQRLAFIRYLYTIGTEQSRQPEPLGVVAVLSLHDSVELFLQLSAEHKNVPVGNRNQVKFGEYFPVIDAVIKPDRLFQQSAMKRLNSACIALKHQGTLPSRLAIEQLRADVTRFFEDNTTLIFGLAFSAVSLVDLVACELARTSLKQAEAHLEKGNREDAAVTVAVAFAQLVDDYDRRSQNRYGRSPFVFGESFAFDSSFFRGAGRRPLYSDEQARFEDKVMRSVVALQEAMKVLSLGIDYRHYARFRLLTPVVRMTPPGDQHVVQIMANMYGRSAWPPSTDQCRFCFDFVIESAVHLQAFDFNEV